MTVKRVGRPSNTVARRSQIVEALLSAMASHGYAQATVARIAARAGLASGLVHYHFENKRQILAALIDTLTARLDARVHERQASTTAPRDRLLAVIDAYVARGADADVATVAAWVVIGTEAVRDPEVQGLYAAAVASSLARLRALTRAVLRAEGRSAQGASQISTLLLAAIEGAYRVSAAAPGVMRPGSAAPLLRAVAVTLLDAVPAS